MRRDVGVDLARVIARIFAGYFADVQRCSHHGEATVADHLGAAGRNERRLFLPHNHKSACKQGQMFRMFITQKSGTKRTTSCPSGTTCRMAHKKLVTHFPGIA